MLIWARVLGGCPFGWCSLWCSERNTSHNRTSRCHCIVFVLAPVLARCCYQSISLENLGLVEEGISLAMLRRIIWFVDEIPRHIHSPPHSVPGGPVGAYNAQNFGIPCITRFAPPPINRQADPWNAMVTVPGIKYDTPASSTVIVHPFVHY